VWPQDKPLGIRVSATDWVDGGWNAEETVLFAKALKELGCDFIDVTTSGVDPRQKIPLGPGYQAHQTQREHEPLHPHETCIPQRPRHDERDARRTAPEQREAHEVIEGEAVAPRTIEPDIAESHDEHRQQLSGHGEPEDGSLPRPRRTARSARQLG
jgi:2,4-dienoyl-CoA reductase-like NADH-dependent reductase (Old Yellow Enzyme family)